LVDDHEYDAAANDEYDDNECDDDNDEQVPHLMLYFLSQYVTAVVLSF
jgi:hypothetical protein